MNCGRPSTTPSPMIPKPPSKPPQRSYGLTNFLSGDAMAAMLKGFLEYSLPMK